MRGIQGLYLAEGAAIGAIFPFVGVILAGRGLDPAAIGAVSALTAVAFTVALPLWGHLGDVVLGRARAMQLAVVGASLAALVFNAAPVPIIVSAIALVALTLFEAPWMAFADAMAVNALRGRARDYARARVIASGSFATVSIASGFLYDRTGYGPASILFVGCAVALAVIVRFVPDVPRARLDAYRTWVPLVPAGDVPGAAGAPVVRQRESLGSIGTVLRVAPRLRGVVAAVVLLNLAVIASFTFLPLRLVDLGASPSIIALSIGLAAVAEIPGMLIAGRVAPRVGLRAVFAFGCGVYAFAFLVWMGTDVPAVIVASRFVSGLGYASFTVAMVLSVSSILPQRLQASGQALMQTAAQGLGAIVANLAGGQLIDRAGYPAMFAVAAVMALIAAVVGWRYLPRRGEPIASRPEIAVVDAAGDVQLAYTPR